LHSIVHRFFSGGSRLIGSLLLIAHAARRQGGQAGAGRGAHTAGAYAGRLVWLPIRDCPPQGSVGSAWPDLRLSKEHKTTTRQKRNLRLSTGRSTKSAVGMSEATPVPHNGVGGIESPLPKSQASPNPSPSESS
jgi:hypothetical protein